ncbi:MAG: penicillin-binding protein 1A [Halocynthiibacter sp.]
MIRGVASFIGSIFSWLTISLVAGALCVGAVLWAYSHGLPDHEQLAQYKPPTISRIYSNEGKIIDEFAKERRLFTPIEDIPDLVKFAFISAEDKNFYSHGGFDARGIASAALEAVKSRGDSVRGASTITQQVMKNFLLGGEKKIERKIKEILLATRLEGTLNKEQILELYLNEIFLGQNSFGVTAAAQTYLNKSLDELAPHEAAFLASLPKAPSRFHPVRKKERVTKRRNYVLREMYENGYITKDVYQSEREKPLLSVQNGDFENPRLALPPRDYFTDEIRRQLSRDFGAGEFHTGGYSVRATIDPKLQLIAAKALRRGLEKYDRNLGLWRGTKTRLPEEMLASEEAWRAGLAASELARDIEGWHLAVVLSLDDKNARIGIEGVDEIEGGHILPAKDVQWARKVQEDGSRGKKARVASDLLSVGDVVHVRKMVKDADGSFIRWTLRQVPEVQGGFMAMDVNTGRVISMQGGFSYQASVYNRATQATRQPGSSFKPFVYAAALDSGYSPATIVIDAPIEVSTGAGIWRPKNASKKFYGPTPLRTGIERSRNLMTIRLAQEVGMDTVASYAEEFGVYDRMNPFLANALGSQETTLYKMVAAYAMFSNGGERVEPTLVDRVQDRDGKTIYRHDQRTCVDCGQAVLPDGVSPDIISDRERVMDAITAYQLTSMMRGVVERGTASRTVKLPVPTAGKTGTTNEAKDVWFVGFTSSVAAGCYMGYDRPKPLGRGASGGGMCGPVFTEFMKEAIKTYGAGAFDVPKGGHFLKIDRLTGARLAPNATGDHVVAEYFRDGEDPLFGIAFDGGFAMGSNLPLFGRGDEEKNVVKTSSGKVKDIGKKATFGTLSSGGEY